MEEQVMNQFIGGGIAVVLGAYGVLAPYRWNVLRLKRSIARHFSQETNEKIPKAVGSVVLAAGLFVLVATVMGMRF